MSLRRVVTAYPVSGVFSLPPGPALDTLVAVLARRRAALVAGDHASKQWSKWTRPLLVTKLSARTHTESNTVTDNT